MLRIVNSPAAGSTDRSGPEFIHHQQLLDGFFQSYSIRNHSTRTIKKDRLLLEAWFKTYGIENRNLTFSPGANTKTSAQEILLQRSVAQSGSARCRSALKQFESLLQYLKCPTSDPSYAMAIALSIFWAFGAKELAYSTFKVADGLFEVQVFQSPLSYGHRRPTRSAVFVLPKKPEWFSGLQNRFVCNWNQKFAHLEWKDKRSLFPPSSGQYPRPMSKVMLFELIAKATTAATGTPVPLQVLRCTAGHIHTHGADASLLTQIGSAAASAFRYTWVPRKFHSPN